MRPATHAIGITCILLSVGLAPAFAGEDWTGKMVILKYDKTIKIGHSGPDGRPVYLAELTLCIYKVLEDKKGYLNVQQGDVNGWFDKKDAMLLEQGVKYYTAKLKTNETDARALTFRAYALEYLGELDEAMQDHILVTAIEPKNAYAWAAIGWLWLRKDDAFIATIDLDTAISLKSDVDYFHEYRGNAWYRLKNYDNAIRDLTQCIRLNAKNAEAFYLRGMSWEGKAVFNEAAKDLNSAVRIEPDNVDYLNSAAWLLATCPDKSVRNGKRAVELATKGCKLSNWKDIDILDTLAAAHAEAGDYVAAVKYQKDTLAFPKLSDKDRKNFAARLKLYEDGRPYRDEAMERSVFQAATNQFMQDLKAIEKKLPKATLPATVPPVIRP